MRIWIPVFLVAGAALGPALGRQEEAAQWSRFRGPNGAGVSDVSFPAVWTEQEYAWKTPLPGVGHGSPVAWDDRVFVTAGDAATGKRFVVRIEAATGRIRWTRELPAPAYRMHRFNSIASSTPAADGERVYTAWGTPAQVSVLALDHEGKTAWEASLGPYRGDHGFGASPVLVEDLVVLNLDQDDGGSLVALDRRTGKVRWQTPRRSKNATYSTPCLSRRPDGSGELIFTNWQHGVTAVDPRTGKTNWELSVFDTNRQERSIASPVAAGGLILGTCGFVSAQKHLVAVRPPSDGQAAREVWRLERAVSYLPTPLVVGERVFLCSEQGIASCLELATGRLIWQERVGGNFYASPIAAGGRVYCVSRDADVAVFNAADEFRLLGRSPLGESSQSTPAIVGGRMLLRTERHLLALAGRP